MFKMSTVCKKYTRKAQALLECVIDDALVQARSISVTNISTCINLLFTKNW